MFHCNLFATVMLIIMFIVPCSSNLSTNIQQQSKSKSRAFNPEQKPGGQVDDGHFLPMTTSKPQPPRSQQLRTASMRDFHPHTSNHHHLKSLQTSPFHQKGNVRLPHNNQFGASNDQIQVYRNNNNDQSHNLASPSEFNVPLLVASGGGGSGSGSNTNQFMGASNILYDQPMALQSMANGNQEQLVNSFYVSGFGTQPMMGPSPSQQLLNGINMGHPASPGANQYPAGGPNDIYGTAAQQNYNTNPEQGPYVNYDGGGGGGGIQGLYGMEMRQSGLREQSSRSRGPDGDEDRYTGDTSEPPIRGKGGRKMLSNDQLMSLIDELKEFNSKEASRLSNSTVPPDSGNKSDIDSDDADDRDNDADGAVPVKKIETSIETKKFVVGDDNNNNEDGGGGKSAKGDDDLVNIAKFLLTKEGAKIRLQLGLDDSDGDDDDEKDQLLESKTRLTSENLREDKLNRFVDSVAKNRKLDSGQGDDVRRSSGRRQNEDKDETYGEPKDTESYERARKRRDHHEISPKKIATTNTKRPPSAKNESKKVEFNSNDASNITTKPSRFHLNDGGRRDNFAKLLIKSELLADKLESAQDTRKPIASPTSSNIRRVGMPSSPEVRIVAAPTIQTRRHLLPKHLHNFQGLDMTPKRGELGQRKEKYSRDERDHDKEVMLDKLEQVREAKAKMRSRVPMPMIVPMVKRALNGEMRMRVDKSSTGDHLLLRNNMGGNMQFKLPQARKYGNNFDKKQPITSSSNNIDNGRLNDSAPIPALIEPEKGHQVGRASIRIQSELPLKDEYPISDRVNDRLNKLSNSLDRYFNDGFLQEIESKSKLEDGESKETRDETGSDHAKGGGGDSHKAEPSIHNELSSPIATAAAAAAAENNRVKHEVASLPGKDHDFDINVSVDGRRDAPDRDPEDDLDRRIEEGGGDKDDDDDDADDQDDGDGESGKAPTGKQTKAKGNPKKGNRKKINERRGAPKKGKPSGSNKDASKRKKKKKEISKKTNDNKRVKPVAKPTGEDLEFENLGKLIDNMDPVENETLDTPIGPDSVSKSSATTKLPAASQEDPKTSNESSSYGKKNSFYQEPD